ncbi:Protein of unknown function [Catalinimonas alkaloidigena]|uniref:DUF1641 domain-containing protein n=1 Tax=Catalinimonas alkaloidigena TaxID=1075417 RepID=A0A1G9P066_9BACT|nr:DUF1641 domain-containing protein [Catalinimonas alkaloidigena]SDL91953.1 Protein of unknown function [Catalinimonas alkaloidigena]
MSTYSPPPTQRSTPTQPSAATLETILAKLETMEQTLQQLAHVMSPVPDAMATATDLLDAYAARQQEQGQDPEENTRQALLLLERLTRSHTLHHLQTLLQVADQSPELVAHLVDLTDTWADQAADRGIDLEDRLKRLQALVVQATAPLVLEKAEALVALTAQADELMSFAVDQVDDSIRTLQDRGLDPHALADDGLQLMAMLAAAYRQTKQAPPRSVGPLGLLKALSDPDFQKFLGFVTQLGKHVGQQL